MQGLTRNTVARKLGVLSSHLVYWEKVGELKPNKIEVGNFCLIVYTPELIRKARRILFRGRRRKLERKREKDEDRKK